ncbi:His_Phos_1 domain-containing protein [Cephalotus follicularis]|uniref:His_Phos_1 domain-containing protein n=1 Tax=Cephalotus follicularis TaxID=3775 RepID=A0A1Q3AVE4_CEPFO|nr:His_Phos_1 domain-containing protein [Cephalotus follicularis]
MGSNQSIQAEEDENDDDEEEEDEEDHHEEPNRREFDRNHLVKKVLEQEPEILPCYASASSPLSPQLSSLGTPRLGPSIKVWDPYNVLAPPPPPLFSMEDNRTAVEVVLVCHGECELSSRRDLVAGRCHMAALTNKGKRQARALSVFLNSQGVRFNAAYSSPLDRARSMAIAVCQEMNFAEEQIQSSDALVEMSMGQWEGCHRSEIYTPEILSLIERFQPDFAAPAGESLRQVEFRMVQFLNGTILGLPEKLRSEFSPHHQNESQVFSHNSTPRNSNDDLDGPSLPPPHWDLLHRHRQGFSRKKSGKSRLQFVTSTGDPDAEDDISPGEANRQNDHHDLNVRSSCSSITSCIGVFTHSVPIKCLLTGLLGCSPVMSHKICIEDSSVTVLQHSWKTGWQIKRLNDTSHLRLL